jgi:hypothetical protein
MRILLDENFPIQRDRRLQQSGYDAEHIIALGLRGVPDSDIRRCFELVDRALDFGVPPRDVQEAASHADPCTTMRYDRARVSPDRHATQIVAAFVAGAG